jgi:hypothetical protein
MSFRGEMHDFLAAATATSNMVNQRDSTAARNQYYKSLINSQTSSQDMQRQRLALSQKEYMSNLDFRNRSLNQNSQLRQDQLNLNTRAQNRADTESQWRMNGSIPGGAGPGETNSRFNGGVPMTTPQTTAPGAVSNTSAEDEDNPPQDVGTTYYPAGDAYNASLAADGDAPRMARGGVVPGPKAYASCGAVDSDAPSGGDNFEGGSDTQDQGHSTEGGFDTKEILDSWQNPKGQGAVPNQQDTPVNPVAVGVRAMQRGSQGQGAVPSGNPQGSPQQSPQQTPQQTAYTPEEIAAFNKAVDPKDELTPAAKTIARLDAGVKFYLSAGQTQKAENMARSLLMYGGLQAQKFGDSAVRAIKGGDMKAAAQYINEAYDNVPDGRELTSEMGDDGKMHVGVKDPTTGQTHDMGSFDTQQVLKLALGLQNGSEYTTRIQQIASGNFGQPPKSAPKQPSLQDRGRADTAINSVADAQLPKGNEDAVRDMASNIYQANGVGPSDALKIASRIIDPTKGTIQATKDGGGVVQIDDGRQIVLPRNTYLQAVAIRGKALKAQQDAKAKVDRDAADRAAIEEPQRRLLAERQALARQGRTGFATQDAQYQDTGQ